MNNLITRCIIITAISFVTTHIFAKGEDDQEQKYATITLTAKQVSTIGVKVEIITKAIRTSLIYAPAELKANAYTSYVVSPRVDSIVLKRHVSLGEHVIKGQPLVTLFSESIAMAQAEYRIEYADWNRVQKLGKNVVSEKNISETQTRYIASVASLRAFGLTDKAIADLTNDNGSQLGEYTLEAIQAGSVLMDDFQQGQRVEAGQALMTLVNENNLWVEARLSANTRTVFPIGSVARFTVGKLTFDATVIQEAHAIDSRTRTRVVRLSIENLDDQLHPGMFGNIYFNVATKLPVIAVPESALIRGPDGDWMVFIEQNAREYIAQEVELGQILDNYRQVSGLDTGLKIVTKGTFFIASEQAKNGFDPHNH